MTKDKIVEYFTDTNKQRKVKTLTVIMFFALIIEKICSGATAIYNKGIIDFKFSLTSIDILCILIYFTTALLVATEVKYKYIVIPDMMLLVVKITNIVYGIIVIIIEDNNIVNTYAIIEKIIESIIFSTFLIVLFIGKLSKGKYIADFSIVCLRVLMICFAVTVAFEILQIALALEIHKYPFLILFDFLKGIINEAFLDMPYFLLVLTLCFTDEKVLFNVKLQQFILNKNQIQLDKK